MAKYLTSGWEHYAFVVTPRELEEILQDMHLLIVTRHVPKGYRETPLSDFVADFSGIYEKLRTGRQVTSREVWTYPQIGVASALEKYGYGRPQRQLQSPSGSVWRTGKSDPGSASARRLWRMWRISGFFRNHPVRVVK